jgi:hypothetical protein
MIGALTIVAILATVLVSATTRHMDLAAANLESTNLVNYAMALQNSVARNRYIPGTNDWASVIAGELGVSAYSVTNSPRNTPRYFLIDPALQIGTNAAGLLPYAQSNLVLAIASTGQTIQPVSPRVMIISTLSTPLPSFIASGVASSTVFSNIWNWTDQSATPPAGWPANWNNYGTDLRVQRISLAPLFAHLMLQNYPPPPLGTMQGRYELDRMPTTPSTVPNGTYTGVDAYVLKSTILGLYSDTNSGGGLQAEQILSTDASFFYVQGAWRGSLDFGTNLSQSSSSASSMGSAFLSTAQAFVSSPYYTNAANYVTPKVVVNAMSNFMVAYTIWANSSFNMSPPFLTPAENAQSTMQTAMKNLVNGIGPGGLVAGACTNPPAQ